MSDFFEPAGRGVQHASLRAANRRAVLNTISFNPGISNADVSRRTGLAPQTASAIVSELEEDGLITRGEVLRGRRGQPATPLYLDYSGAFGIGCDISWRHVDVVLINLGSEVIGRYRRDYRYPDAATIVAEVANVVAELLEKLDLRQRARMVGLGITSPTQVWRGIERLGAPAEQFDLWRALDIRTAIARETGLPASWSNDGSSACFATMVMSDPPRPANLVHLYVTTFLGAGIAAEHTLYEGPTGNSADLGSMLVNGENGRRAFGHDVASMIALEHRLTAAGVELPEGDPADWPWDAWEPHVTAWIEASGSALAEIVFNTAAVLEVDRVIIDSVAPPAIVARLVEATTAALAALAVFKDHLLPPVSAGVLGDRAPALGAAQLIMFRRHFSRQLEDMLAAEAP